MVVYVCILILEFLLLGKFTFGGRNKPHWVPVLCIFSLMIVLALRFDVGADYSQYYSNFQKAIQRGTGISYEPLNNLLFFILKIFKSPHFIIVIYGILTLFILFRTLKNNVSDLYLGVLSYTSLFYLNSFSTIRQGLATVIVLSAYPYLKDRKYLQYFILCVIAILFHYSAVVCIFFPLLFNCRIKYMLWVIGFSSVLFIVGLEALMQVPFFSKYASYIVLLDNFGGGSVAKYLYWVIILGLWICKGYKHRENRRLLVLCTFGCVFPILLGGHLGGRLAQYMYIFLCIAIPNVLSKGHQYAKIAYIILLNIWFLAYVSVATDFDEKAFLPYQTIFEVDLEDPKFKESNLPHELFIY